MKKITSLIGLLFGLFLCLSINSFSQVTLSQNDLVVLQYNSDYNDEFALLALADITAGDNFFVSDGSWDIALNNFNGIQERGIKVTVGISGISAGTIIRFERIPNSELVLKDTSLGTLEYFYLDGNTATASYRRLSLSSAGDQILIFQTSNGVITSSPTFIYGFNTNLYTGDESFGWLISSNLSYSRSNLPTNLVALDGTQSNKTTASAFGIAGLNGIEVDNYQYTGATTPASRDDWLTRIHTLANWSSDNNTSFNHNDIANGGGATVITPNTAPTFTSTPITTAVVGQSYSYPFIATDADGDALSYTVKEKPSWLRVEQVSDVSTLAGSTQGFLDDTGTAAQFYNPYGVAVDKDGNVYVADYYNHKIRKITSDGVVSTLAGSTQGFLDGTGTAAQFRNPRGVAVDAAGYVYVADRSNNRIRKITPAGVVSTLAGSGSIGSADGTGTAAQFYHPSGVAVDADGYVYVADRSNNRIRKITSDGAVSTLAGSTQGFLDDTGTVAKFSYPTGVAVASDGNVYVADRSNNRIRKITPAGVVSTLAGSTQGFADGTGTDAQFNFPRGVAVDATGNVYVADSHNNRIRKITPNGAVSDLAGSTSGFADGTGTAAQFSYPYGVSVDAAGNVYVADYYNNMIRKITNQNVLTGAPGVNEIGEHYVVLEANDGNGGTVEQSFTISVKGKPSLTVSAATSITSSGATLNGDVTSDGNTTITERGFVYALTSDDQTPTFAEVNGTTVFKVKETGTFTSGTFSEALTGLKANLEYSYVAYATNSVGTTESAVKTFTTLNTLPTFTSTPITSVNEGDTYSYSITTNDADGDDVTITATTKPDWLNLTTITGPNVTTFAGSGAYGSTDANGTAASFNYPYGVAVDGLGNVYVPDFYNHKIRMIAPNGDVTTLAGTGSKGDTDANGTSASFNSPTGVAVDGSGNVYVADYDNHKIRMIARNGDVTTVAGSGNQGNTDANGTSASFNSPFGVAVDGDDNVYVADARNHKIRKIAPNGDVTTLAGTGSAGNTDANGTFASFNYPYGIAVDGDDNVYVADAGNYKIRKIARNGDVTTVAGSGNQGNTDANGTSASFKFPVGVAVDGSGNVYVSDAGNHKIRKIAPNGDVTTLAGTGSAGNTDANGTFASFNSPYGVAVDGDDNVYVSDVGNHKIRKITTTSSATLTGDSTEQAGVHNVVLEANDGNGGVVQQTFTVTVKGKPSVTADAATDITSSGATLKGDVTSDGNTTITERGFVYALTSDDQTPTFAEVDGTTVFKVTETGTFTSGTFSEALTDLKANSNYSYVAYATNSVGTTESAVKTFTTSQVQVPVVTTPNAAIIVNADTYRIWGTHPDDSVFIHIYADADNDGVADSTTSLFSSSLSDEGDWNFNMNLTRDIAHNFVVKAIDSAGNISEAVNVPTITEDSTPPEFTADDPGVDFYENEVGVVYTSSATDAHSVVYSVVAASEDGDLFSLDVTSGAIRFKVSPDFESPKDTDRDNLYIIVISATDIVGNQTIQHVGVTVKDVAENPIVSSKEASKVSQLVANLGGTVTDQGGAPVTERGIVYALKSEQPNPTLETANTTIVEIGDGIGSFEQQISGLQASTEYAYVAYATNTSGTGYGTVETFTTLDLLTPTIIFTDITDKTYGDASFDLGATSNSTGAITYEIRPGGDGLASLSGANNQTVTLGNAGNVKIKATQEAEGRYTGNTKEITLTIGKALLTVTASAGQTKKYGTTDPTLTYSITGFRKVQTQKQI